MFRKHMSRMALKFAVLYLMAGGIWIYSSDAILALLIQDRSTAVQFSIIKGLLFILLTATLFYLLIDHLLKEISQARNFYLEIFEDFPTLIRCSGPDGTCNYFNKTWLAFTGRTLEQERGDGWTVSIHHDDLDSYQKACKQAIAARQPFTLEYRLRRHDGECCWIIDQSKPYYNPSGKFAGYIATCSDATERKRAENDLLKSEKRFRELTENTSDWVWEVDENMRYVYSSPVVGELLGYEPTELGGKTPFDLMTAEEAERLKPALAELISSPRPFNGLENVNVHKDGYHVVLETSGVPLFDAEGNFTGFRGIDRDITARKAAEEKIKNLNAELEEANKELEAFGYTVSHDLRSPLTTINLSCQVIMDLCGSKISDQCKSVMQEICEATERMGQLISSLLCFSRVSRDGFTLTKVDLSAMARVIAAELQLVQPERQAVFTIADGVTAYGDTELLRLAMTNIIGNAWKYTGKRETTVIDFGVTECDGERVYFIRDNGTGFDMNQADKLFTAFERLHKKSDFEGHGIGLATVQRIIHRHGGRVWAEGEVDKGATFYFVLPPEQRTGTA